MRKHQLTTVDKIGIQPSHVDTNYKAVSSSTQMSDLDILCNHCTVYDSSSNIKKKIYLRYDARNERFVCEQCRRVVGESQVRNALNLNQEEYIHYEKTTPIRETILKRQAQETYEIQVRNPVPLHDPSRKPRAIIINNRDRERKPLEKDDDGIYKQ